MCQTTLLSRRITMARSFSASPEELKQSWLEFGAGLMHIVQDIFLQRLRASHLPKSLKLPPLSNFSCIVTGCTSGIGLHVAHELAKAGAHLVMACRNTKAANELIKQWQDEQATAEAGTLDVQVMKLDLLSLTSVRTFAIEWEAQQRPLHLLVNNAGIFSIGAPLKYSHDGFEEHLQVNHLAPALLTLLLLPSLLRSSPSRIVNVNSDMHRVGFRSPEDLNFSSGGYTSMLGYSSSKLSELLFQRYLQERIPVEAGVDIIAVHPGIVLTNVVRTLPKFVQSCQRMLMGQILFSPAEGARGVLFCCIDHRAADYVQELRDQNLPFAPYFSSNCQPAIPGKQARNAKTSLRVWQKTLEMLAMSEVDVQRCLKGAFPSLGKLSN